jgi:hypothetical protein
MGGHGFKKEAHSWVPVAQPVILATQEAEIKRIVVQSQPCQMRSYLEKTRAGEMAEGIGPEFKSQYHKKKKSSCL